MTPLIGTHDPLPRKVSLILERDGQVFEPTQERWCFIDKDVLQQFAKQLGGPNGQEESSQEESDRNSEAGNEAHGPQDRNHEG